MTARFILLLVVVALVTPADPAVAQKLPIGIVSRLAGSATVERDLVSGPGPLKTMGTVFLRDRIVTADDSLLQVLLGGKAVLTMRGASALTSREALSVATLDVAIGGIRLAVDRNRMSRGQRIAVVTPNAVATVSGTVLVVEVSRQVACDADPVGIASRFTVLAGQVEVALRDATGHVASPLMSLGGLDTITISRCALLEAPSPLADVSAGTLDASFRFSPSTAPTMPAAPTRSLPRLHP